MKCHALGEIWMQDIPCGAVPERQVPVLRAARAQSRKMRGFPFRINTLPPPPPHFSAQRLPPCCLTDTPVSPGAPLARPVAATGIHFTPAPRQTHRIRVPASPRTDSPRNAHQCLPHPMRQQSRNLCARPHSRTQTLRPGAVAGKRNYP